MTLKIYETFRWIRSSLPVI